MNLLASIEKATLANSKEIDQLRRMVEGQLKTINQLTQQVAQLVGGTLPISHLNATSIDVITMGAVAAGGSLPEGVYYNASVGGETGARVRLAPWVTWRNGGQCIGFFTGPVTLSGVEYPGYYALASDVGLVMGEIASARYSGGYDCHIYGLYHPDQVFARAWDYSTRDNGIDFAELAIGTKVPLYIDNADNEYYFAVSEPVQAGSLYSGTDAYLLVTP